MSCHNEAMKYLIRAAVLSIMCLPIFASAQTAADISAQAQALLAQIAALQAQLGVTNTSSGGSGVCYSGATVKPGTSGANVTALQTYLASDPSIYPEGKVTGFYGALTQAAVGRWQASHGIVTSGSPSTNGFGSVGPRTAAAMAASCGGGSSSNDPIVGGFIKVSPVSGEPPLRVSVETTINTVKSCLPATYTLSWGDGSQPLIISIPANKCDVLAQTYTHTYTLGGEYTIKLASGEHETTSLVTVNGGGGASINGSETFGNTSTGGSASTGGGSTQAVSGALTIGMTDMKFSPAVATVTSGTKVTWTNNDSTSHTVTADNSSYNSGTLAPGQSYSLTFTTKGEYTYYCAFHGGAGGVGMSGKIVVQ